MTDILQEIAENVILGRADKDSEFAPEKVGEPGVKELVQAALDQGVPADDILHKGLLAGMDVVGVRFKADEIFVPEVMVSADAFKAGMAIIQPLIAASGKAPENKVVIGTVKGDLHDIGKNIVGMMFQGAHFDVIDLGVDVPADRFIQAIKTEKPKVIALSALLTTTMAEMKNTIHAVEMAGLREHVKIMVGGAPVTKEYAEKIGADGFAPDAVLAVEKAKELLGMA